MKHKWTDWPPSPVQWISAIFLLVGVAVAATWQVARVVTSERLANLQMQLHQPESQAIPLPTESTTDQPQNVTELAAKIETLEQEKNALVAQMADLSRDALDPRSELGVLVRQLESDNKAERIAAATGLFAFSDPQTVQPLVDYYWKYRDEADNIESAHDYMNRALRWDKDYGVDFIIRVLESDDEWHAEQAYNLLLFSALAGSFEAWKSNEFDRVFRPAIENLALRSEDTLVRTRAKVILQRYEEWLTRMNEMYSEEHGTDKDDAE